MSLYDSWNRFKPSQSADSTVQARGAIARGQALFNTKPISIVGVKGLNDDLDVEVLPGTCTTCHNSPNSGNHSTPMPLDIGISDASRRTPDMPLYTLRNTATGEEIQTTDPGRALITGKWKDIGRLKGLFCALWHHDHHTFMMVQLLICQQWLSFTIIVLISVLPQKRRQILLLS